MQICSKLLIEKMFYYKFFCQTIQCPKKEGGHNVPPSDVSPTKKHANVTRVKNKFLHIQEKCRKCPFSSPDSHKQSGNTSLSNLVCFPKLSFILGET